MSNHRENALAFGLTRALALLEKARKVSDGDSAITNTEIDSFHLEMEPILSKRHTLRDPATLVPGLSDASVVGMGQGWLIQLLPTPLEPNAEKPALANADRAAGKVTLCREIGPDEWESTHTGVFFSLYPDPMAVYQNTDPGRVAEAVGHFVEVVLKAKGLEDWAAEIVFFSGGDIPGTNITFPRDSHNLG